MPPYKKTILSNGLTVITSPYKESPAVAVLVVVEAGSDYETSPQNGISHFLEHMVFKGTKKRPSALIITEELERTGAHYNAFTGNEYTGYYTKVASRFFDTALDVISDIFMNPLLDEKEIEKEKGVVVEEIRMYNDIPQRKVRSIFAELAYGDQPAGRSIAGTEEKVRAFKREDIERYRNERYVPSATTVVIAGAFNEEEALKKVESAFAVAVHEKSQGLNKSVSPKPPVITNQTSPKVKYITKQCDQTHIVLGVRSYDVNHKDAVVAQVIAGILGGGMSSRLFQKLREDMGLCYYIHADADQSTDHGMFTIVAGVDATKLDQALEAILKELGQLRTNPVSESELSKVKQHAIGSMMLSLETSDAIAEFYGFQQILKHAIKSPTQIAEDINAVTPEDIMRVSKDIFVDSGLNLAVIAKGAGENAEGVENSENAKVIENRERELTAKLTFGK